MPKALKSPSFILFLLLMFTPVASGALSSPEKITERDNNLLKILDQDLSPESIIFKAASSHRILILGERHMMAQPKELLAGVLPALHSRHGYCYLALEIGDSYQEIVDKYLATGDESLLRDNPWTLLSPKHATREFLEIYRTVYRINADSESKIKILCIDVDPQKYAIDLDLLKSRNRHMKEILDRKVFSRDPGARLVIYIGGGHGAKRNIKEFTKSIDPFGMMFDEDPLGMRLESSHPEKVFSLYIDGIVSSAMGKDTSISEPGLLFEKGLIQEKILPLTALVPNDPESGWKVMSGVPVSGVYDGYIFFGKARKPERLL